jgi:TPR repeat protein
MNRKIKSREEFESALEDSLTEKEKITYLTFNFTSDFTLEAHQLNQIITLFPNLCSLSLSYHSVIHSTMTSSSKRAPKLKYFNLSIQDVVELTPPILLQTLKGDEETFEAFKELVKQESVLPTQQYALGWMHENTHATEREAHDREAFELYTLAANRNHPGALYNLAMIYRKNRRILTEMLQNERNLKAFELLQEAAKKELRRAQYALGLMHEKTRYYEQAIGWYKQAAEQGHPEAQYALGSMCEEGLGGAVDYAQARLWYKQAAAQDHSNAYLRLGCLWALGKGVPQNDRQAVACFKEAANLGNKNAAYNLGRMCMVNRGFDEISVLERNTEAFKWILQAARKGLKKAQWKLAEMYEAGQGVTQNESEAFKWYERAAKQGLKAAQFSLGSLYMQNKGLPQRMSKQDRKQAAFNLFTLAAQQDTSTGEKGEMNAQFNLGLMYFHGDGVTKDLKTALFWFKEAAEQKLKEAQYFLGCMYESGQEVEGGESPENYAHALRLYTLAAEQGYAEAQYALGHIYANKYLLNRELQKENDKKAVEWLTKAIVQNHPEAHSVLQWMRENGRSQES